MRCFFRAEFPTSFKLIWLIKFSSILALEDKKDTATDRGSCRNLNTIAQLPLQL